MRSQFLESEEGSEEALEYRLGLGFRQISKYSTDVSDTRLCKRTHRGSLPCA